MYVQMKIQSWPSVLCRLMCMYCVTGYSMLRSHRFCCSVHLNRTTPACALRYENCVEWQVATCTRWANLVWKHRRAISDDECFLWVTGEDRCTEKQPASCSKTTNSVCMHVCGYNMTTLHHHQCLYSSYSYISLLPIPDFSRREECDD